MQKDEIYEGYLTVFIHERICKWVLKYSLEKKVSESKNSEDQTAQDILMSNPETVDWINDILNVENEQ